MIKLDLNAIANEFINQNKKKIYYLKRLPLVLSPSSAANTFQVAPLNIVYIR